MITSWRIVTSEYASTAFTGEGASLYGGRWNLQGTPLVYTAQSAALAALEILVHTRREKLLRRYVLFACLFDESLVESIERENLPDDWRAEPAPAVLADMGQSWIQSRASAVLCVPNAIIESELTYVLNPAHPDFAGIDIRDPIPFALDLRLLSR